MNQSIKFIKLTKNKFAIVDEKDFDKVSKFNWHVKANRKTNRRYNLYAGRQGPRNNYARKFIYMHTCILNTKYVDHINNDGLDNRRVNLRKSNPIKNQWNRREKETVGIRKDNRPGRKKRYRAVIMAKCRLYSSRYFLTKKEAIAERKKLKAKHHAIY